MKKVKNFLALLLPILLTIMLIPGTTNAQVVPFIAVPTVSNNFVLSSSYDLNGDGTTYMSDGKLNVLGFDGSIDQCPRSYPFLSSQNSTDNVYISCELNWSRFNGWGETYIFFDADDTNFWGGYVVALAGSNKASSAERLNTTVTGAALMVLGPDGYGNPEYYGGIEIPAVLEDIDYIIRAERIISGSSETVNIYFAQKSDGFPSSPTYTFTGSKLADAAGCGGYSAWGHVYTVDNLNIYNFPVTYCHGQYCINPSVSNNFASAGSYDLNGDGTTYVSDGKLNVLGFNGLTDQCPRSYPFLSSQNSTDNVNISCELNWSRFNGWGETYIFFDADDTNFWGGYVVALAGSNKASSAERLNTTVTGAALMVLGPDGYGNAEYYGGIEIPVVLEDIDYIIRAERIISGSSETINIYFARKSEGLPVTPTYSYNGSKLVGAAGCGGYSAWGHVYTVDNLYIYNQSCTTKPLNMLYKTDIAYADTNWWGTGYNYGRILQIQHGTAETNGTLFATFERLNSGLGGNVGYPIYMSDDNGATWEQVGEITDQTPGIQAEWQPTLFELPQTVGDLSAGTLLCAACSVDSLHSATSMLQLYKSTDMGENWSFVSTIVTGGAPGSGVWEPFLLVNEYGDLVCYFSDETEAANHSQKICYRTSSNGTSWSSSIEVVASNTQSDRPGMPVVTKLGNGDYFMTFELVGRPGNPVCYKKSSDGLNWGSVSSTGTIVQSGDKTLGSAPFCGWTPINGSKGTLIVSGTFMRSGTSYTGTNYFISYDYGSTWTTVEHPLPYTASGYFGYSNSFAFSSTGKTLFAINNVNYTETHAKMQFGYALLEPET